ncbi:MAG: cyclopropane-fatty-acyl-phospholipid synthase [Alteromonadaceae bacterium]|nr:cyclopropane-fatty-acyl-phospholipid synthase [Alteromonadaceae bacterium]|tara:strand:+ start:390 stop:1733 length:1344 start_codon:yes stop_codon:yes gene_type:complete
MRETTMNEKVLADPQRKQSAVLSSNPLQIPDQQAGADSGPLVHERWLAKRILMFAGTPPIGIVLWDGEVITVDSSRPPEYQMYLKDRRALYELAINPHLSFGDLYSAGRLEVDGKLHDFFTFLFRFTEQAKPEMPLWLKAFWRDHAPRSTAIEDARNNIHHHYDLGNEFYRLWLDQAEMQYTCAYYERPDLTLEQAQLAKLEHVCRKLQLKPGQTVVEAGCGWGGLARYMAREYGVKVLAYNISTEQIRYAREQAEAEGLSDRIDYILDDYRNINAPFDAFVSIGMLEHVGTDHYETMARVIRDNLRPDGLALIHTIGRNKPAKMNAWIEKRIFPGAYPPSIGELMSLSEAGPFSLLDAENLRLHYALTLEAWLDRFEANVEHVRDMYDEHFVRAWRFYLSSSIAAFRTSGLQLFQIVLAQPENNAVPYTRRHLYQSPAAPAEENNP